MSPTTFAQLPRELRDIIWPLAAAAQYEQVNGTIAHHTQCS